jgi:hypothetical protein
MAEIKAAIFGQLGLGSADQGFDVLIVGLGVCEDPLVYIFLSFGLDVKLNLFFN